jgi:hypothetical protein
MNNRPGFFSSLQFYMLGISCTCLDNLMGPSAWVRMNPVNERVRWA